MNIFKEFVKCIWGNKRLFFVFALCLFILVFFSDFINTHDSMCNYGFSYALSHNQVPFVEFNTVTPGFYSFLMSLGLRFISDDNIVFLCEQALLITIAFYFLYKMFDDKAWLFLLFMIFPSFVAFNMTYNFGILFLSMIVLYLEQNNKSDYLIGVFLGLLILTKHTIGVFLLIPSIIFYYKDTKKLFKRFLGVLIPCLIYLVYLVISGSFMSFLDLCVFGLFDFAGNNTEFEITYFVLSVVLLIINIIYVWKNKKDILGWYVLFSYSVMFPIFGGFHFYIYFVFISLLVMSKIKLDGTYVRNMSIVLSMIVILFNSFLILPKKMSFLGADNLRFVYLDEQSIDSFEKTNELYNKYKKLGDTRFLSGASVWLSISNNEEIDYFTVLLTGNYGYNGTNKMINKVKETPNMYYMIDYEQYIMSKKYHQQFDCTIIEYIMDNSKFIEEVGRYKVYYYSEG